MNPRRAFLLAVLACCLGSLNTGKAQEDSPSTLETEFGTFLKTYSQKIEARDSHYLGKVHPKLPKEMQAFFFDVTSNMMSHARQNRLDPAIECNEFQICKVTWPQPGGSWASQRFIMHLEQWRGQEIVRIDTDHVEGVLCI